MGIQEPFLARSSGRAAEDRGKGLALSEGRAVGRVCLFSERRHIKLPRYEVTGEGIGPEVDRLKQALRAVGERLESLRRRVEEDVGAAEAEIFAAQRMIVEDPKLSSDVVNLIVSHGVNAEVAIAQTLDRYASRLAALDDAYLKERASDLGEIKQRILTTLEDSNASLLCASEEHCRRGRGRIVVAEELTPALTMDLNRDHVLGFVTERGGPNSHAAILARALGIPAVSGLQGIRGRVSCGTEILIDGGAGEVVIWPSDEALAEARPKTHRELRVPLAVPAVPGFRVLANIGTAADVRLALDVDAEGIGLYRTEVEVIEAGLLLNEDALAERYTAVVRSMEGRQVVFRMFDVGSDKPLPTVEMPKEDNPALGCRGARFLLARSDLMRSQARALARASVHGKVHVMYPMVVNPEQFLKLRDMFADATADLLTGEILHGAMLEVPSACLQTAEILADADFASVGTNDLLQYLFAADRNNALVATDAERNHHTLWTLLRSVVEAARSAGKPVSVCGEIAADPSFIPRLIDLGFTCVSVSPRQLGNIRLAARAHLSRPAPPPSPALEA